MYNYAEIPHVEARDDLWHRKYTEDEQGHAVRIPSGAAVAVEERPAGGGGDDEHGGEDHGDGHGVHMPSPSYFPLVLALGLPILGYAAVFQAVWLVPIGGLIVAFGLYAWAIEPQTEP
jgi:cytochrome c oxidase subunit 1